MDLSQKKRNKKIKKELYPKDMLDRTSNQINYEGTKSNGHEENLVFTDNEPLNCTDFGYSSIKKKKLKKKHLHFENLNGTEDNEIFPLSLKEGENLHVPNDLDDDQNGNFDTGKIGNSSILKKQKKSYDIDSKDLHKDLSESLVDENSPSKIGKKRKKKVSISMVEESYQEEALSDRQVHTSGEKKEEKFSLGDEVTEEDSLLGLKVDDLITRIEKKKKKKKIFPDSFENLQQGAVLHPDWNKETKEKKKKKKSQKSPAHEECEQEAFQNHYGAETSISKVDESYEQENDPEENPNTSGLLKSLHVKKNVRKKQGKNNLILDEGELSFIFTDSRHSDQQPNDTSTPKMKIEKFKDLPIKNISENVDITSPDCTSNTVDDNEGHNVDKAHLPYETLNNFNNDDSIIKSGKRQKHISKEEAVDINESLLSKSSIGKKGGKRKRMNSTFDQSDCNLTLTEGTMNLSTDEARPISVKRKKRSSEVENSSASDVIQLNKSFGKNHSEDVNAMQQRLDLRDEPDKTAKKKESKLNKEEVVPVCEVAYHGESSFEKRPKNEMKSSPKKIHVQEEQKRDSKPGLKSLDSKIASALDVSAAVSKFEAELLKSPNSKRSTNVKQSPSVNRSLNVTLQSPNVKQGPNVTLQSPNVKQSPNVTIQSPNVKQSPKVTLQSPNVTLQSPNVKQGPNVTIQSPNVKQSPKVTLQSPNVTLQSPNVTLQSPNVKQGPNVTLLSPNVKQGPNVTLQSPNVKQSPEVTLQGPDVKQSTNIKRSPYKNRSPNGTCTSPRYGFALSSRKGFLDRATQTDPPKKGEFPYEKRLFEPIISIVAEDREFITSGEDAGDMTQQSYLRDEESLCRSLFGSQTPSEQKKKFECGFCEKKFPLRHHLERHLTTHTPRPERSFACTICDKQYVTERSFKLHRDTHTDKKYQCDVCNEKFFHPSHVRAHAVVHQDQTVKCDICNEEFVSRKALNGHLAKHIKREHKCEFCGKLFCYRSTLDQHMTVHSARAPKVYECELCPKEYRSRQNLHDHLRSHGEKKFECPQCDKKFYLNRQLNYHMLVHTDQRPYPCDSCEKAFKRGTDRTSHCWCHFKQESPAEKRKLISDAKEQHSTNMHLKGKKKFKSEETLVPIDDSEKLTSASSVGETDGSGKSDDKDEREDSNTNDETREEKLKRRGSNRERDETGDEEERDTSNTDETLEEKEEYHKCKRCRRIYRNGDKSLCDRCILRS